MVIKFIILILSFETWNVNFFNVGEEVLTQMLVVPDQVLNLPGRPTSAEVELAWMAKDIPALGFASYHVTKRYTPPPPCEEIVFRKIPITIGYKDVTIIIYHFLYDYINNNKIKL